MIAQHEKARAKGNDWRYATKVLKRQLRSGGVDIREVLSDPPEFIQRQLIIDVISWAPRVGPKALVMLGKWAVADSINLIQPMSSMNDRTLRWLLEELPVRTAGGALQLPRLARRGTGRRSSIYVTAEEKALIREMGQLGKSNREIAAATGRSVDTASRYAGEDRPQRYVANAALRKEFVTSGITTTTLARELGWVNRDNCPDTSRVRRSLGLARDRGRFRGTIERMTAKKIENVLAVAA